MFRHLLRSLKKFLFLNGGDSPSAWEGLAISVQGSGHVKSGLPCQDSSRFSAVTDGAVAVVADGCGSASQSQHGSQVVVDTIAERFCCDPAGLVRGAGVEDLISSLQLALNHQASELNCSVEALASTLVFVAVFGDKFCAGNLGDGVVGVLNRSGEVRVLLDQERGEFVNQTVFVTSKGAKSSLRIHLGPTDDAVGFVLMSDGAAESLYNGRTGGLAPAVAKVMNLYETKRTKEVGLAIRSQLMPMLKEKTSDDCSVAFLRKQTRESEELNSSQQFDLLGTLFLGLWSAFESGVAEVWEIIKPAIYSSTDGERPDSSEGGE